MASPSLSLNWNGGMKFASSAGSPAVQLDSGDPEVASPTQALAYGLMGCMAMDVVFILEKGRHALKGLTVHFDGERAEDHPKRFTTIRLNFEVTGDVPEDAVSRALELSHKKYCSVSNTLRQDIEFTTRFTIKK